MKYLISFLVGLIISISILYAITARAEVEVKARVLPNEVNRCVKLLKDYNYIK